MEAATAAFQQVQGLRGRVFLVGEIADRGQTSTDIEVAVTDADDRQTLTDALDEYRGRLIFHLITGEPGEKFVEVTPGAPSQLGGREKANPQQLEGVFVG